MSAREQLRSLIAGRTGIEIARGGIEWNLDAFIARRMDELGVATLDGYVTLLGAAQRDEFEQLVNAITVTHTWFLRDAEQLGAVEQLLTPGRGAPLRVWVAGCATGEDAYSVAMIADRLGRPAKVLGTDVNTRALMHARRGRYGAWTVREVNPLAHYFTPTGDGQFALNDRLKNVAFEQHNLLERPPYTGFDLILCRNVLIYFSRARSQAVLETLAGALAPGGHLVLGASEVVFDVPPTLEPIYVAGRLVLRRVSHEITTLRPALSQTSKPVVHNIVRPPILPNSIVTPRQVSLRPQALVLPQVQVDGTLAPARVTAPELESLLRRGHLALDQGDLEEAERVYSSIIEDDPTHAEPHLYVGLTRYLNGDVVEAMQAFRSALCLDAWLLPAAFYLAICYDCIGYPEEALREFEHVVRLAAGAEARACSASLHGAWHADMLMLAERRVFEARRTG